MEIKWVKLGEEGEGRRVREEIFTYTKI